MNTSGNGTNDLPTTDGHSPPGPQPSRAPAEEQSRDGYVWTALERLAALGLVE